MNCPKVLFATGESGQSPETSLPVTSSSSASLVALFSPAPSEPASYMPEPYLKYSADELKFNNYARRYLSPRITSTWRVGRVQSTVRRGRAYNIQTRNFLLIRWSWKTLALRLGQPFPRKTVEWIQGSGWSPLLSELENSWTSRNALGTCRYFERADFLACLGYTFSNQSSNSNRFHFSSVLPQTRAKCWPAWTKANPCHHLVSPSSINTMLAIVCQPFWMCSYFDTQCACVSDVSCHVVKHWTMEGNFGVYNRVCPPKHLW